MSNWLDAKRKRLDSLNYDFIRLEQEAHQKGVNTLPLPAPSPDAPPPEPPTEEQRALHQKLKELRQEIALAEDDLQTTELRQAVKRAHRNELLGSVVRYGCLILGSILLTALAYIFRQTPILAAIPLVGLVALLVLWPVYDKFRQLQRVQAEFTTQGVSLAAAASETDEFLRLQGEVAKKRVELDLAKLNQQLDSVRYASLTEPVDRETVDDDTKEVRLLASQPESETKS